MLTDDRVTQDEDPRPARDPTEPELPEPARPAGPDRTVELVAQAAGGDAAAWEALYGRYRRALLAILRSHMREVPRSRFDTEDVLQSTFLSAYTALDDFEYRGPESFRKWLTSILMHKLFDKLKYHAREQRDAGREDMPPEGFETLQAAQDSPSMEISRFEGQARLLGALAELDVEDQELLTLRFFERRTWPEVARALGAGEATVRRRMPQALERLTRRLREAAREGGDAERPPDG